MQDEEQEGQEGPRGLVREFVGEQFAGEIIFGEPDKITGNGMEFTERNVTRLLEREPMAAPGAPCPALAWRSRIALLAR